MSAGCLADKHGYKQAASKYQGHHPKRKLPLSAVHSILPNHFYPTFPPGLFSFTTCPLCLLDQSSQYFTEPA